MMNRHENWLATEQRLQDGCTVIKNTATDMITAGFSYANSVPIPTDDLNEWLSGSTEVADWFTDLTEDPEGGRVLEVGLTQNVHEDIKETCLTLTGSTKSGSKLNIMYLIHFNEEDKLQDSSGVYYDFIDRVLVGSKEADIELRKSGKNSKFTSEQGKWDSLALEIGAEAVRGVEKGPLTLIDIESVKAVLEECKKLA